MGGNGLTTEMNIDGTLRGALSPSCLVTRQSHISTNNVNEKAIGAVAMGVPPDLDGRFRAWRSISGHA
jgi:hypothetical protein